MTMLIMWLIELYLNDLGSLNEEVAKAKHEDLEEEFRKFLAQTKVKVGNSKGTVLRSQSDVGRFVLNQKEPRSGIIFLNI